MFGEDALVCETRIDYRVFCVEKNTVVWSISGAEFRKLRERRSRQDIEFALSALQKHQLFYILPIRTITNVVESFTNRKFNQDEVVLQKNKVVRDLFLVTEGKLVMKRKDHQDEVIEAGQFVALFHLLRKEKSQASYLAKSKVVKCAWIPIELLSHIVGDGFLNQISRAMSVRSLSLSLSLFPTHTYILLRLDSLNRRNDDQASMELEPRHPQEASLLFLLQITEVTVQ